MKHLKKFLIPFTGLKIGVHTFEFDVDKLFFDAFEYSLVKDGDLKVTVNLEKQETMLILDFVINGSVKLVCDTCLAEFSHHLNVTEKQIIKFGEENAVTDDIEIVILNKNQNTIDISAILYEVINVSVPYIKNCEKDGNQQCDQTMIAKLKALSGEEKEKSIDPRWETLKNIK